MAEKKRVLIVGAHPGTVKRIWVDNILEELDVKISFTIPSTKGRKQCPDFILMFFGSPELSPDLLKILALRVPVILLTWANRESLKTEAILAVLELTLATKYFIRIRAEGDYLEKQKQRFRRALSSLT